MGIETLLETSEEKVYKRNTFSNISNTCTELYDSKKEKWY